MKKLLIAFSALVLVLSSCSSTDDNATPPSNSVLVKKMVQPGDYGAVTTNFTYNGDKMVKGTSDDGTSTVFIYTGSLITEIKYYIGTTLDQKDIYTYDSNSRVASHVMLYYGDEWGNKREYVYNTDGTISVTDYNGDLTSQENVGGTSKIYFTNGEVTKMEDFWDGDTEPFATTLYTYDSKNSPFKNVLGFDKITFTLGRGMSHNMLTETDGDYSISYQYTYNSNDYPVTEIEGDNDTTLYFYN